MARIIDDPTGFETWKNTVPGKVVIKRMGRTGELVDEMISGERTFHITPAERRLNQEMAADEFLDFFQNGVLVPVKLIESAEDVEAIKSNPNLVTEDEMKDLIENRRAIKAFQERVESIRNPTALQRMLELAKADDNATVRQLEVIEARLKQVAPSLHQEIEVVDARPVASGTKNAISPR